MRKADDSNSELMPKSEASLPEEVNPGLVNLKRRDVIE